MKNNLVLEMQQMVTGKKTAENRIPMPTYLYVQRYGRMIEYEMDEITSLLGEKQHFIFKTGRIQKEKTLLSSFLMELEKNALVGKEFSGCVLIELSETENMEEFGDFLEYVAKQKEIRCIFTINANQDIDEFHQMLEQYFFVRVVEGQEYDCTEQLSIIESAFTACGFELEEEGMREFENFFREKEWQETDMVENLVQNIARNLVYEKMLNKSNDSQYISATDAQSVIQKMQRTTTRKQSIGFHCA